ncbi:MAG: methyltransferase domain-containing protein [Betaproteobacteria bacterium]|nr:methyltransferase domain-containing protein [Betaproteobacteria bacterium]
MLYKEIAACRLCDSARLTTVLDLGVQALTGIFPKSKAEDVAAGPLQLCKCEDCDLVQLRHNYDLGKLYGETYGYRSGLNQSMVRHLHQKVGRIRTLVDLREGDLVIDIGSNDSTLLQAYPERGPQLVGIDPSGPKFARYYPPGVTLIPDFFRADLVKELFPGRRAKVVTSIAMFYDLERPMDFVRDIVKILDDEGVWVFEQSYLPFMLKTHSYDTVCHEHLEYYALKQIKHLTDHAGLRIIGVEFNDVNGGSFSVTAARAASSYPAADLTVGLTLEEEEGLGLYDTRSYAAFAGRIRSHRQSLLALLDELQNSGKRVLGYGASTKGNVLLQYCGITAERLPFIAEVNQDKFGAYTPGSKIPIISEEEARAMRPDYFLVLPWHFRAGILQREQKFLQSGGKFIFPLPKIEVVSGDGVETLWASD